MAGSGTNFGRGLPLVAAGAADLTGDPNENEGVEGPLDSDTEVGRI